VSVLQRHLAVDRAHGEQGRETSTLNSLSPGPGMASRDFTAHQSARIHNVTVDTVAECGHEASVSPLVIEGVAADIAGSRDHLLPSHIVAPPLSSRFKRAALLIELRPRSNRNPIVRGLKMNRPRLRFKALEACALAFSLMAIWAGAAQAESTGGSWAYIGSGTVEELKTFEGSLAEPEIGVEIDTTLILHAEALEGTKVLYECKKVSAPEGKLKGNGVGLGRLVFAECVTFLNGSLSAPCKPKGGIITTNQIKAQMLLHKLAGGTIDKILMAEGETEAGGAANFASIASEGACALGTKVSVGGKIALELSNPTTHEVKHLFKEFAPLTAMWIISNTAEHKASLLGSGWAFLSGAHVGLKWAGLWSLAEETGGSWTYIVTKTGGEALRTFEGALAEPEINGEVDVVLVLHAKALEGTEVLYECTAFSAAAGSKLKANGVALGKLIFTGCTMKLNGVLSEACKPKEGKLTTNLIKAQMLLHKLADGTIDKILIAEPENEKGESITTFVFIESTASCALGIKVSIGGKFAIEPTNPTTHEVKHLFKEFAPLTAVWIISNTAEHKASLLGSGWAFLTGAHFGLKWAGLWL
jgi:hypothetical protein